MRKQNIIVAGSRSFTDFALLKNMLDCFIKNMENVTMISGSARGTDKMGERYAEEKSIPIIRCPADWKRYGKAAGLKRNEEMAKLAISESAKGYLFAFWDLKSLGTKHMIEVAKKYKLEVRIIEIANKKTSEM